MKKPVYLISISILAFGLASCVVAAAADKEAAAAKAAIKEAAAKEAAAGKAASAAASQAQSPAPAAEDVNMSKEEIVKHLEQILVGRSDIAVDGLQVVKGETGASVIYKGKKLEDCDKETLVVLMRQVNQQASWKNMESLQKQLRALKQIEDMNRIQKMSIPKGPYEIPKSPAGYNPSAIQHKTPAIPPPAKKLIKE